MTNLGMHLADLRALSDAEIANAIISVHDDLVLSRYRDNVWDISPYFPVKNSRHGNIRFDLALPDGSCLTDARHALLLDASKRFLYVRWRVKAPHSRKHVAARTVLNNWAQLRVVLKWMVAQGIKSFGQLTSEHCLAYAASKKSRLKGTTLIVTLQVLTTYYDLRDHLSDPLPEYPWGDSAPVVIANANVRRAHGQRMAVTQVIPARILRILVQTALDYVEHRASRLLEARDEIEAIRKVARRELVATHRQRHPRGFASIYVDETQYLQVRLSHFAAQPINGICSRHGFASLAAFRKELRRLRTACHIICAVFSGMRDSELASLEIGCFGVREGYDGELYCWIKGMTYKLEEDPTPAEWMVPEIVGKAVDVATRLGAPERALCAERIREIEAALASPNVLEHARRELLLELTEAKKHQHALMFTEHRTGRILSLGSASAISSMRDFSGAAGAIVTQADMEGVTDHSKIQVGDIWPLSPHQFRRTFAVFVSRNLMGDVRYLREHFKHWSIDMTLYYARHDEGLDVTVFSEILTERDELQAMIMENWIKTDTRLAGGGGQRIMTFKNRGDVKTVKNMRDFCRKIGEDVYIRGTGHSWCMSSGDGCGGQGLYDAVRCTSCGEGVIDDTHVQIWRGIRQQQIEVLQCADLGAPSWERCVEHLREAERTLSALGDVVTPYAVRPSPLSDVVNS